MITCELLLLLSLAWHTVIFSLIKLPAGSIDSHKFCKAAAGILDQVRANQNIGLHLELQKLIILFLCFNTFENSTKLFVPPSISHM